MEFCKPKVSSGSRGVSFELAVFQPRGGVLQHLHPVDARSPNAEIPKRITDQSSRPRAWFANRPLPYTHTRELARPPRSRFWRPEELPMMCSVAKSSLSINCKTRRPRVIRNIWRVACFRVADRDSTSYRRSSGTALFHGGLRHAANEAARGERREQASNSSEIAHKKAQAVLRLLPCSRQSYILGFFVCSIEGLFSLRLSDG